MSTLQPRMPGIERTRVREKLLTSEMENKYRNLSHCPSASPPQLLRTCPNREPVAVGRIAHLHLVSAGHSLGRSEVGHPGERKAAVCQGADHWLLGQRHRDTGAPDPVEALVLVAHRPLLPAGQGCRGKGRCFSRAGCRGGVGVARIIPC